MKRRAVIQSKPASVAERLVMRWASSRDDPRQIPCVIVARDRVLADRPLQCAQAFPPVPEPMHSAQLFSCAVFISCRPTRGHSLAKGPHSIPESSMGIRHPLTLLAMAASLTFPAVAKAEPAIDVTIKDHLFTPSEIHVPAGKPATLNIKNEDETAEEFESHELK